MDRHRLSLCGGRPCSMVGRSLRHNECSYHSSTASERTRYPRSLPGRPPPSSRDLHASIAEGSGRTAQRQLPSEGELHGAPRRDQVLHPSIRLFGASALSTFPNSWSECPPQALRVLKPGKCASTPHVKFLAGALQPNSTQPRPIARNRGSRPHARGFAAIGDDDRATHETGGRDHAWQRDEP